MFDLDNLFARLSDQPADRGLGGLAASVNAQIDAAARGSAAGLWGVRAAAVGLVAAGGLLASAAATAAPDPSPFAAWSSLAPSTLLESGG